ncbi:MAG: hypothetical protein AAGA42_13890 [Actinomycetota bacterium]
MRSPLLAALAAATIVVAACGSDDDNDTTDTTTGVTAAETDAAGLVTVVDSELGEILADANGFTLYGFTEDVDGVPTCEGGCAGAWPPLVLESPELPEGLDAAVFSVVERPDGTPQLKAGDWPLYRFASDFVAGDITGQDSGGVWFVVAPDGSLIGV